MGYIKLPCCRFCSIRFFCDYELYTPYAGHCLLDCEWLSALTGWWWRERGSWLFSLPERESCVAKECCPLHRRGKCLTIHLYFIYLVFVGWGGAQEWPALLFMESNVRHCWEVRSSSTGEQGWAMYLFSFSCLNFGNGTFRKKFQL